MNVAIQAIVEMANAKMYRDHRKDVLRSVSVATCKSKANAGNNSIGYICRVKEMAMVMEIKGGT